MIIKFLWKLNADVQGGLNIIKKAIPKAFPKGMTSSNRGEIQSAKADSIGSIAITDGIEGVGTCSASPISPDGLHPIRINPLTC